MYYHYYHYILIIMILYDYNITRYIIKVYKICIINLLVIYFQIIIIIIYQWIYSRPPITSITEVIGGLDILHYHNDYDVYNKYVCDFFRYFTYAFIIVYKYINIRVQYNCINILLYSENIIIIIC